jgi:hypothetical protein
VFHIKNIDKGKNVAVNGFESSEPKYTIGERNHVL